jgi:hypothetical protein
LHLGSSISFVSYAAAYEDPTAPPIKAKMNYKNIITKMHLLVIRSSFENFIFAWALFCITLVSCPVKTAMPYTYSVFLKLLPLNTMLSAPKDIRFAMVYISILPSNLYMALLGNSQLIWPSNFPKSDSFFINPFKSF